jgi:hypothetical protein
MNGNALFESAIRRVTVLKAAKLDEAGDQP